MIQREMMEGTVGPGIDVSRAEPLSVWTAWPEERTHVLKLIRVTPDDFGARVYDVETDSDIFPFSEYQVAVVRSGDAARRPNFCSALASTTRTVWIPPQEHCYNDSLRVDVRLLFEIGESR